MEPRHQFAGDQQGHAWIRQYSRVCAGTIVDPGDLIVADDDGVVVVKREDLSQVLHTAEERVQREVGTRERLAQGELGLDIYGLRKKLSDLGLRYS